MKKLLFVFNPQAGKAKIKARLSDIIDIFVKGGYMVSTYTTQCVADATKIVAEHAPSYDLVVCSGGDGTLNEVVNGMLECGQDIPIGYIPAGSTNDYGRSLGISKNMLKAARNALEGADFHSDLGMLNGQSFVYVAAFGLFTEVSYQTNQQFKNLLGHAAYILSGVKSIASVRSYPMKITVDDEVIEDRFILGMVTNTISVGGFKGLTGKDVVLDDGYFEVILIRKPSNPLELNGIMNDLLVDSFSGKCVYRAKAKHVHVESSGKVAWTMDGEYGGELEVVDIENRMRAFTIRVDEERLQLPVEERVMEDEEEESL